MRFLLTLICTAALTLTVAAQAPAVVPAGHAAPIIVNGSGSCASCGPTVAKSHSHCIGAGTASPVGCTCWAAEKTFLFGSCKQFFTPGNTCGGCGSHGRNPCPTLAYGPGGLMQPANNCQGPFSYTFR